MKNKEIDNEYKKVFNILESLYLESRYNDIIQIRDNYEDSFLFDESKKEYTEIVIVFSDSYFELKMFNESLILINKYIDFIKNKGYDDEENMDNLTTFFHSKIIIYQKTNKIREEYLTTKEYLKLGGTDPYICNNKSEIEHIVLSRFYSINKVVLWLNSLLVILMIVFPSVFYNFYFSIITSLVLIFVFLIYVFQSKVNRFLINIVLN